MLLSYFEVFQKSLHFNSIEQVLEMPFSSIECILRSPRAVRPSHICSYFTQSLSLLQLPSISLHFGRALDWLSDHHLSHYHSSFSYALDSSTYILLKVCVTKYFSGRQKEWLQKYRWNDLLAHQRASHRQDFTFIYFPLSLWQVKCEK